MPASAAIQWAGLNKTLIAIVLSPLLGLILTMMIMLATSWLGVRASARGAERTFRGLHLVSAGAYSLGHGLNDAQKTMGVITVLLYSTGYLHGDFAVPHWVALSCYVAIGLGTLTGGWRIIETMGTRITKLDQHQGFSASAGGIGDAVRRLLSRHSGVDHAHHHRLRDRRRRGAARIGGALGHRPERHDRVDHHHPGIGDRGRLVLLADQRLRGPREPRARAHRAGQFRDPQLAVAARGGIVTAALGGRSSKITADPHALRGVGAAAVADGGSARNVPLGAVKIGGRAASIRRCPLPKP